MELQVIINQKKGVINITSEQFIIEDLKAHICDKMGLDTEKYKTKIVCGSRVSIELIQTPSFSFNQEEEKQIGENDFILKLFDDGINFFNDATKKGTHIKARKRVVDIGIVKHNSTTKLFSIAMSKNNALIVYWDNYTPWCWSNGYDCWETDTVFSPSVISSKIIRDFTKYQLALKSFLESRISKEVEVSMSKNKIILIEFGKNSIEINNEGKATKSSLDTEEYALVERTLNLDTFKRVKDTLSP